LRSACAGGRGAGGTAGAGPPPRPRRSPRPGSSGRCNSSTSREKTGPCRRLTTIRHRRCRRCRRSPCDRVAISLPRLQEKKHNKTINFDVCDDRKFAIRNQLLIRPLHSHSEFWELKVYNEKILYLNDLLNLLTDKII